MAIDPPKIRVHQLFIDGEWHEPALGHRLPVINPSTEDSIGTIPAATAEDVELAVRAAREALTRNKGADWARATGKYRAKYLRAIAAKVLERKDELARLEAIDCGKPLDEAAWDMVLSHAFYIDKLSAMYWLIQVLDNRPHLLPSLRGRLHWQLEGIHFFHGRAKHYIL